MVVSKKCPCCRLEKDLSEFGVSRNRADGLNIYCRPCVREKNKAKYYANPAKEIARVTAAHKRNPEPQRAANRRYAEIDGGKRNREKAKRFYHRNRKKQLAKRRAWEKANPEKHTAEKLRWQKRRGERDPTWRMMRNISRHIAGVLNGGKRGRRTMALLGYTKSELRVHVEALFRPGMSWDNYGEWHLDHRRPKASFDFKQPNALQDCWSLSNLQPLWKLENHQKSDRWIND
jgi:hypothetical protein